MEGTARTRGLRGTFRQRRRHRGRFPEGPGRAGRGAGSVSAPPLWPSDTAVQATGRVSPDADTAERAHPSEDRRQGDQRARNEARPVTGGAPGAPADPSGTSGGGVRSRLAPRRPSAALAAAFPWLRALARAATNAPSGGSDPWFPVTVAHEGRVLPAAERLGGVCGDVPHARSGRRLSRSRVPRGGSASAPRARRQTSMCRGRGRACCALRPPPRNELHPPSLLQDERGARGGRRGVRSATSG